MKKFFLSFLLVATLTGFAQKVSSKISLAKGQKLEMTINMNMNIQSMMGESSGNTIITEMDSVNDVTGGNITLTKIPKHVKSSFSLMGRDVTMDSDKPEDL